MRAALLALFLFVVFTAEACEPSKSSARPVPTPGPQAVVRELTAMSGGSRISRGERIRFAVAGTGSGTHFSGATFVASNAFTGLRVVAVMSSRSLYAQGTVSVSAPEGHADLAVVTGTELALDPWAFDVVAAPPVESLGAPPASVAAAIEQAGAAGLFQITPMDSIARTIVFRIDRDPAAPPDFRPTLEVYSADGRQLAAPASPCVPVQVNSRAPLIARVADPLHQGSTDRRYRFTAVYGDPVICVEVAP